MRRTIILLLWLLSACRAGQAQTENPSPALAITPPASPSIETATEALTATPEAIEDVQAPWPYSVHVHPEGGLFVGDVVSFEVTSDTTPQDQEIMISIEDPAALEFGSQPFNPLGFNGQSTAKFLWVWDTHGFEPGEYVIVFEVIPDGPTWRETIQLRSTQELQDHFGLSSWEMQTNNCCRIYYLTGTASQRDLETISANIDAQAEYVVELMEMDFAEPPEVVVIPRVIGHGGFASDEVYVSYLDRNYTSNSFYQVLRHEMVHLIDRQIGGGMRPSMLAEGYAVFLSGGHYKPEALMPRAAALLTLEWYIPLPELAGEFYLFQHELGYLEAGGLIEFMTSEWGRTAFEDFYRDIDANDSGDQVEAINRALIEHFSLDFEELDALYVSSLAQFDLSQDVLSEMELMVAFYDTVRRYQGLLDRSAHFQSAWFLDIDDMWDRQITADYQRSPASIENIVLEIMLADAGRKMGMGDALGARELLAGINGVLYGFEENHSAPLQDNSLGRSYHDITTLLLELGYSPQLIELEKETARAIVQIDGPELIEVSIINSDGAWVIVKP